MTVRGAAPMTARGALNVLAAVHVAPGTFLAIVAASALAGTVAAVAGERGVLVPVVVLELLLGVVLGPHVLGLHADQFIAFFSDLGLGLLFFFAGYEIDMHRIMPATAAAGAARLGAVARARVHDRRRARGRRASCCRCCTRARRWRRRRSAR